MSDPSFTTSAIRRRQTPLISGLVILNIALVVAIILSVFRLPNAFAQAGLERGEFICVTGKATGFSYDVLYVLDLKDHRLHAFHPGIPKTKKLINVPSRDLLADFAKEDGQ